MTGVIFSQMLTVSRLSVLTFALFAGVWSIALIKIGIDINWLFFVIGLLVASVFPPISFLLTWNAVGKVCIPHVSSLCACMPGVYVCASAIGTILRVGAA
jgi:hypothetical protein